MSSSPARCRSEIIKLPTPMSVNSLTSTDSTTSSIPPTARSRLVRPPRIFDRTGPPIDPFAESEFLGAAMDFTKYLPPDTEEYKDCLKQYMVWSDFQIHFFEVAYGRRHKLIITYGKIRAEAKEKENKYLEKIVQAVANSTPTKRGWPGATYRERSELNDAYNEASRLWCVQRASQPAAAPTRYYDEETSENSCDLTLITKSNSSTSFRLGDFMGKD